MSKYATPGELRTAIKVYEHFITTDDDGFKQAERRNVFEGGEPVYCKWVNAHGSEVLEAKKLGLTEPATLTLRYTPKLTATCEIYKMDEPAGADGLPNPFEVISIDDVENRHQWLEVKVKRKVVAK